MAVRRSDSRLSGFESHAGGNVDEIKSASGKPAPGIAKDRSKPRTPNAGRKPPIRKEKGMDKNAPTRESSARMVMGNLTHLADRAEALEKLVLEKLAPVLTCPPKGEGIGGVKSDWPPLWSEAQGHIDRTNNALCAIETLITAAEL